MSKIVVLGSCNTDMVVNSERLPEKGETLLGGEFSMHSGGKGANQAVAASRLGGSVVFIAKVGDDTFGKNAVSLYEKEGIDTRFISTDPESPSGIAQITVDKEGNNTIVVAMGSNGTLVPDDFSDAEEEIKEATVLLMQLETPMETIEYAARLAHKNGVKVILNPAPAQSLSNALLKNLFMVIPNESEASLISGVEVKDFKDARKAADVIYDKGVEKVVITMGEKGVFLKDTEHALEIAAHEVNAVDATAAGDTFCGAVAVAISEGKTVIEALEFANKCSALTVTKMGAQTSIPTLREVKNFFKS